MTEVVYLDNNATTRVDPQVLEAMLPYFSDYYGNPSSMHSFGGGVGARIRTAREQLAQVIGASPEEIVFTSCGTESDSTAIHAAIKSDISCAYAFSQKSGVGVNGFSNLEMKRRPNVPMTVEPRIKTGN